MIELGPVTDFIAGALGPPGQRRFLIEIETVATGRRCFLLEKQQVGALAQRMRSVLAELGGSLNDVPQPGPTLSEPDDIQFRVGDMAVAYGTGTITVVLQPAEGEEAEPVSFDVTIDQAAAMTRASFAAVAAGRPICPRCQLPMDPGGHVCPASNGDLRRPTP